MCASCACIHIHVVSIHYNVFLHYFQGLNEATGIKAALYIVRDVAYVATKYGASIVSIAGYVIQLPFVNTVLRLLMCASAVDPHVLCAKRQFC